MVEAAEADGKDAGIIGTEMRIGIRAKEEDGKEALNRIRMDH